ncbi:helix-turn-helix domain-containing protein [Nonomuraea phyllanthi]|uniref:Helix-turn-helix domain-containing protein n=1 Tax=Nonomuraea phyllanthi TaxID=2219224 RepID=A0A5C4V6F6_9ACTN|nr:helix-turn-helix transcriptional regulator [Nonomuraea phyllanthi]KAB8186937.1 helix-turn-helix domain-containing protein [Nonomuraea phyllanthi]
MRPEDVEHGTQRGYAWHRRRGEHACGPCMEAHGRDLANRRARRAEASPLGRSLTQARQRAGLSEAELAEQLGWSSPYSVGWVENGSRRVSLQALEEWAAALGCRIELIPGEVLEESAA